MYALAIFFSAFLVFAIQPMISKRFLPLFGGTSTLWTISLLFFTTALFIGYLYVYLLTYLPIQKQKKIHLTTLTISFFWVVFVLMTRGSLIFTPDIVDMTSSNPSLVILLALSASIGLPYIVLASTSPLLQNFYSRTPNSEPYHLYAISNVGSFVALIIYPLVIERFSTISDQLLGWALGFLIVVAIIAVLLTIFKITEPRIAAKKVFVRERYKWNSWLFFSAIPTFLLVSTTSTITQRLSPFPLLWIIPLAIYLLSFVLAFSGKGGTALSLVIAAASTIYAVGIHPLDRDIRLILVAYLVALFFSSLFFHAQLYKSRPPRGDLSRFYLFASAGGAIGTFLSSIAPPVLFNNLYELEIGLSIALITLWIIVCRDYLIRYLKQYAKPVIAFASLILIVLCVSQFYDLKLDGVIFEDRDFYGSVQVTQTDDTRYLYNNGNTHGLEFLNKNIQKSIDVYLPGNTALENAIDYQRKIHPNREISIGVVGLGSGMIAAYCDEKTNINFFEISPLVVHSARNYFSYLNDCKNSKVEIGDGRILLEQRSTDKSDKKFDLIIIDAFNGASIPTHLLTKEAIQVYKDNLRDKNSMIALHVTNVYLDLKPVGVSLADDAGFHNIVSSVKRQKTDPSSYETSWVVMSDDNSAFKDPSFADTDIVNNIKHVPVWTDEKIDMLRVLR